MSSPSNKSAKQAQANQDQKDAQVSASTQQINNLFDSASRTQQYGQLASDTTNYYTSQLDQQKAQNDRSLKFSLSRSGQTGSSLAADQSSRAAKDYLNGVLDATRRGQAAGASLQSSDQTQRANLIAQAQGGLDVTSAAANSAAAMRSSLQTAQSGSTADSFGDAFKDFGAIYSNAKTAADNRRGVDFGLGQIYSPGFGSASPSGRTQW